MVKKILLIVLNAIAYIAFIPISVGVLAVSARARNGLLVSWRMIQRCDKTHEIMALLCALEAAEDHRYRVHLGIDPIAIVRAVASFLLKGRLEGGSTIEQQFVRTCTRNAKVSIIRKVEELSITVWMVLLSCKDDIAYSYLQCAYFGHRLCGYKSAMLALPEEEYGIAHSPYGAAAIVSLLKRPKPAVDEISWKIAHQRRIRYVLRRQFGASTQTLNV